jgi:hypothetical protein
MIGAFAVDGTFDVSARLIGEWLTTRMGQRSGHRKSSWAARLSDDGSIWRWVPIDAHSLLSSD